MIFAYKWRNVKHLNNEYNLKSQKIILNFSQTYKKKCNTHHPWLHTRVRQALAWVTFSNVPAANVASTHLSTTWTPGHEHSYSYLQTHVMKPRKIQLDLYWKPDFWFQISYNTKCYDCWVWFHYAFVPLYDKMFISYHLICTCMSQGIHWLINIVYCQWTKCIGYKKNKINFISQ